MLFHTIVLACSMARAVIPRDIAPGFYAVAVVNGTEEGEPIRLGDLLDPDAFNALATPSRFRVRDPKSLGKRWNKSNCYPFEGGEDLDHRTADEAKANLMAQCGDGHYLKPGHNYYAIRECVVSYFCHWHGSYKYNQYDDRCSSEDAAASFREIDSACGAYKPGQRREAGSSGYHTCDIAYGVESYCTSWGHDFCAWGA